MIAERRAEGRSAWRASSLISGAGPSSAAALLAVVRVGMDRPSSQPITAETATTAGNGTAKRLSATNEATASPTRAGWVSPLLPSRTTAWITIAITAGASPRNTASTRVVSPAVT